MTPESAPSSSDAQLLLATACRAQLGPLANPDTLAILTAHWALETDNGRCMPGHNFGGIKAAPAAPGMLLRTVEGHGRTEQHVFARFRSYENAQAGARDYVHLLATRYPTALVAASAGDARGFAHALAKGGYFTADPSAYAAGLEQRLQQLQHRQAAPPASPPGALSQLALSGLLHAMEPSREDT
jgi:flagellum-specific peptidoglycan hydrolase FlgJ